MLLLLGSVSAVTISGDEYTVITTTSGGGTAQGEGEVQAMTGQAGIGHFEQGDEDLGVGLLYLALINNVGAQAPPPIAQLFTLIIEKIGIEYIWVNWTSG
jgi:hypothetical protein